VKAVLLIAKPYLVHFYVSCGFRVTRLSPVVHGKDAWMELVLDCDVERRLAVVQVDAFAAKKYEGNPAAVVVMSPSKFDAPDSSEWMQKIALERNLSETAFLARIEKKNDVSSGCSDRNPQYRLRWFTPGWS